MKRSVFVFLVLILDFGFGLQAHAAIVKLEGRYGQVGHSFDVLVWADGEGTDEALCAFGFDVFVSGTNFSYTGYTLGSYFQWDASDPLNPANVAGAGRGAFDDEVLLATLSFDAIDLGSGTLSVEGIYDGMFDGLFYQFSGADIFASQLITIKQVPVPAALLLFGSALAGLVGYRKKFGSTTE